MSVIKVDQRKRLSVWRLQCKVLTHLEGGWDYKGTPVKSTYYLKTCISHWYPENRLEI